MANRILVDTDSGMLYLIKGIPIRLMLDDKSVGAKGLITFNVGDFQDVCHKNSIDILF